jgi:Carboxypeptidase regulatory-like domain
MQRIMTRNQKPGIPISGFSTSPLNSTSARQLKPCFRIAGKYVRPMITTILALALRQPIFAQAQPDASHTTVVAGAQLNAASAELPEAPRPASDARTGSNFGASPVHIATATITGTVLDVNGDLVPGATVVLNGEAAGDRREVTADDSAGFKFDSVNSGIPYEVTVQVKGFSSWTSPAIVLEPSQFLILDSIHLKMEGESTSVTVYGSTEEIAVEQVHLAEQQRVFGFIPNFYVNYDGANAAPLTTELKFKLAMRVARDPISILGVAFMSGIDQASNRPDYVQGAKGYGQRFGANAAGAFSDILLGGAVLPSLLHQDPRYFYQGTGTTASRLKHAVSAPFICRGDNGNRQINFSSMGGVMGATALSMAYYPSSNRGSGDMMLAFSVSEGARVLAAIAQEFIIPRFTPSLKRAK